MYHFTDPFIFEQLFTFKQNCCKIFWQKGRDRLNSNEKWKCVKQWFKIWKKCNLAGLKIRLFGEVWSSVLVDEPGFEWVWTLTCQVRKLKWFEIRYIWVRSNTSPVPSKSNHCLIFSTKTIFNNVLPSIAAQ